MNIVSITKTIVQREKKVISWGSNFFWVLFESALLFLYILSTIINDFVVDDTEGNAFVDVSISELRGSDAFTSVLFIINGTDWITSLVSST